MFNIVSFGTSFSKLFDKSVEYNEKNFNTANAHVQSMASNMGGTNIINPMKSIFSEPSIDGVPRQIFLLTDGEVNNRDDCIDTVKKFAKTTRVFTFGIGQEADQELVKGMAIAAQGNYEIIYDGDNMDDKVLRQLSRALKPAFVDMKINWGELNDVVEQTPFHCPPMFSGGHIIFYGVLPKKTKGTHEITFRAKTPEGPFATKIAINFDEPVEGEFVTKLAAKSLIRDLQDGLSYMHSDNGDLLSKHKQKEVDAKIIQISLKNQVMSKLTAFVAVEKRKEATVGTMQRIDMKEKEKDSVKKGGIAVGGRGGAAPRSRNMVAPMSNLLGTDRSSSSSSLSKEKKKMKKDSDKDSSPRNSFRMKEDKSEKRMEAAPARRLSSNSSMAPPPPPSASQSYAAPMAPSMASVPGGFGSKLAQREEAEELQSSSSASSNGNEVRAVIKQQAFNGSFSMQTLKSLAPKADGDAVKNVLKAAGVEVNNKNEAAAVTLMVAALFELKFADQKNTWDLVVKKAKQWAKKELGNIDTAALETAAKNLLAAL
jgi:hypothetical protein